MKSGVCPLCNKAFTYTSSTRKYCFDCADVAYKQLRAKTQLKWRLENPEVYNQIARRYRKRKTWKSILERFA